MKKSSVFEWCKRFKEGRENVEDDERSGRPRCHRIYESVKIVLKLVHSGRRLTIITKAIQLNLDKNGKKGLNFGPAIGFSITAVLQLTRRSLSSSFWPKNR
jgi:hypothetical protein